MPNMDLLNATRNNVQQDWKKTLKLNFFLNRRVSPQNVGSAVKQNSRQVNWTAGVFDEGRTF